MDKNIVPPRPTIKELEQKAQECKKRAQLESEPSATALREEAQRFRDWAKSLQTGFWKA
jgi:hypothetical protein